MIYYKGYFYKKISNIEGYWIYDNNRFVVAYGCKTIKEAKNKINIFVQEDFNNARNI